MPGGRVAGRQANNQVSLPSNSLSQKLCSNRVPPAEEHPVIPASSMAKPTQGVTMDRILQEILAVGRKLEGMDSAMAFLTAETKSMRLDIAGFQSFVTGLDQDLGPLLVLYYLAVLIKNFNTKIDMGQHSINKVKAYQSYLVLIECTLIRLTNNIFEQAHQVKYEMSARYPAER
ncbi:hypothetical protein NDU88_006946 [Pleurodeles waltl]|uniref:Uncharacterized protein n=1 Tax=Pleurodeles waltl TaxID=8319 RepID=A0AAV7QMK0_PLEWA|nr:hypothetical protein NDU88_006946 [Pleurodeles waltl]